MWGLASKWENPDLQRKRLNGEEVITTHSLLMCDAQGGQIVATDSGQSGEFAEIFFFLAQMDDDYPGLREILADPYASLYLVDGMPELAMKFLTETVGDGSIETGTINGNLRDPLTSVINTLMLSAIGHLDPSIDVSSQTRFMENMENLVTKMNLKNGADSRYFDKKMLDVLQARSNEVAAGIAAGGFDRWYEEHKGSMMALGDMMMNLGHVAVIYSSYVSYASSVRSPTSQDYRDAEIAQANRANTITGTRSDFYVGPDGTVMTQSQYSFFNNEIMLRSVPEIERTGIARVLSKNSPSPIPIPQDAAIKIKTDMRNGSDQIEYIWKSGDGFTNTVRWHTRTNGAPIDQGTTWVIERKMPGHGGVRPYSQFYVQEDGWITGREWYDAITARQNGTATPEQVKILDNGHWEAN